jgi:hypothetical protein
MQVDLTKPGELALALIDVIVQMSDEAEAVGGATSIAGVAQLHRMQTSIQKNKTRIRKAISDAVKKAG